MAKRDFQSLEDRDYNIDIVPTGIWTYTVGNISGDQFRYRFRFMEVQYKSKYSVLESVWICNLFEDIRIKYITVALYWHFLYCCCCHQLEVVVISIFSNKIITHHKVKRLICEIPERSTCTNTFVARYQTVCCAVLVIGRF